MPNVVQLTHHPPRLLLLHEIEAKVRPQPDGLTSLSLTPWFFQDIAQPGRPDPSMHSLSETTGLAPRVVYATKTAR